MAKTEVGNFLSNLLVSPLDPTSTWRSMRFQGGLLFAVAVFGHIAGVSLESIVNVSNETLRNLAVMWNIVGQLNAASSARPF